MLKYFARIFHLSAPQAKVLKIHLYIFYGYIILCVLYFFFHHDLRSVIEDLSNKSIADGFSSSVAHTLFIFIFGLLVSCITVLATINDPKDGTFETRVKALVNSEKVDVDDELFGFLRQLLTRSLAFNRLCQIHIEIKDYNEDKKAFSIFCEIKLFISNMCRDNEFYTSETRAFVKPDIDINGDWGTILHLRSFDPTSFDTIDSYYNFHKLKGVIDENKEVTIPKNGEIGWLFSFIIWNQVGNLENNNDWYFCQIHRYTRKIEIKLTNKLPCKTNVKIRLRHSRHMEKKPEFLENDVKFTDLYTERELKYDDPVSIAPKLDAFPKDRIELFVHPLN